MMPLADTWRELPRRPLLGTSVNKGKKKQLSSKSRGKIVRRPPRGMVFEDRVEDEKQLAHAQATNATFFGLPAARSRS
jgi:hypothetical protein